MASAKPIPIDDPYLPYSPRWPSHRDSGYCYSDIQRLDELRYQATKLMSEASRVASQIRDMESYRSLKCPTQHDLDRSEALANAYSEMMVIWKLVGEKK